MPRLRDLYRPQDVMLGIVIGISLLVGLACSALLLSSRAHAANVSVVDRAAASTVLVMLAGGGHGTGVVVGKNRVITAAHVAKGADNDRVSITLPNGKSVNGMVNRMSDKDVAVIDADTGDTPSAPLSCEPVSRGLEVIVYGNPLILRNIATWGHVAAPEVTAGEVRGYVPLDITILPGNSGGGVWNTEGRVVGLSNAVLSLNGSPLAIGFMTPMAKLCPFITFDQ